MKENFLLLIEGYITIRYLYLILSIITNQKKFIIRNIKMENIKKIKNKAWNKFRIEVLIIVSIAYHLNSRVALYTYIWIKLLALFMFREILALSKNNILKLYKYEFYMGQLL